MTPDHHTPVAVLDPRDPFGDPVSVPRDGYANHALVGGSLSQSDYAGIVARAASALEQAVRGGPDVPERADLLALRLLGPLRGDRRPTDPVGVVASDRALARLATDRVPHLGDVAADRLLGPWADVVDPRTRRGGATLRTALAAAFLVPLDDSAETPLDGFNRLCRHRRTRPSKPVRDAVRAVGKVPPALWNVVGRDGQAWTLAPLVDLHLSRVPEGPVHVPSFGAVAGAVSVGDTVFGRVLPAADGWTLRTGLVVPGHPGAARITRWLSIEMLVLRLRERRASVDDLLRLRGHAVCRRLHEWAWSVRWPV